MQKSSKVSRIAGCCPIRSWGKPWQISGLRAGVHAVSMSCCPIEIGEVKQAEAVPDNTTHKGKASNKAVRPLTLKCDKSQQNVKQQGCPKLPADSMFGVAQEVADFEGLLDLPEEGFDTPAAFSSIHAVGHQRDGCRINGMDYPLEATGQATVTATRTKLWTKRLKVAEDAPAQLFDHIAVAVLVGVGKRITAWCNRSSYRSKLSRVMTQAIANIVQSNRVGQLRKQKTDDMTPRREGACLLVHPVLTGKFFRQMRRDEFAKLMQCAAVVLGRRGCFHSLDSLVGIPRRPTLFFASNNPQLHPMG